MRTCPYVFFFLPPKLKAWEKWSRVGGTYPVPPHKSGLCATVRNVMDMRICQQIERIESYLVVVSDFPYDAPVARKGRRHHFLPTSPKSCMRRHMKPSGRKIVHTKHNKLHNKETKNTPPDAPFFRKAVCQNGIAPACL